MSILLQFFAPSFWTKLRRLKSPKRRPPLAPTLVWLAGMYGGQNVTSLGKKRICCFKSLQTRRSILFEGSKRLILRIRLENTSPLQLCFNQPVQPTRVLLNFHPTSIFFSPSIFLFLIFFATFHFQRLFYNPKNRRLFSVPPEVGWVMGKRPKERQSSVPFTVSRNLGDRGTGCAVVVFFCWGKKRT